MDAIQLFERLGAALAIGFLIGIERGWDERTAKAGARTAGVRTFALIGLLGGVVQALSGFNPLLPAVAIAAFTIAFAAFAWTENQASDTHSATGFVTGVLTFALGALAVYGAVAEAAAAAVAAALLLAERQALHTFLERLRWSELRAALVLLAMTIILLPVLPNRPVDPWHSLNPYELWAMTAAIAALSYGGYVCVRVLGERRGLLVGALVAALVSSTAVTVSYAMLPRPDRDTRAAVSAGIAGAWAMSLMRMSAVALVLSPALIAYLVPPFAIASAILMSASTIWYWRSGGIKDTPDNSLREPFDLGLVLRFGLLLAFVVLAYKLVASHFGDAGILPLAALSGFADVDPITLTVAKSVGYAVSPERATTLILLAGTTNFLTRAVILSVTKDWRFALPLVGLGVLALGCAWISLTCGIHFS
jgi:uncharacterized membrane protein (DUF4010 family)